MNRVLMQMITCMIAATTCAASPETPATPTSGTKARPTEAVPMAGCVTGECHVDVKSARVLHGPVNVNACDACHKLVDAQTHRFEMQREKAEVCTFCHKVDPPAPSAVVHKPLAEGRCLDCHSPHGGTNGRFLRGQTMQELCSSCHKDVTAQKSRVHGPVAAGACDSCHRSHEAPFAKLLVAEGRDLCVGCHVETKTQIAAFKVPHKAMDKDCMHCHDPHASNFPMQVKAAPADLCTGCHEHANIAEVMQASKVKHSVVTEQQGCLNCHTAHGGNLGRLMKAEQINLCMNCHDKKIDSNGRSVAAVSEVLNPKLTKHGSIRDGNCGGCHNVHGSEHIRLLAKAYPEPFYQKFELEHYDLCFDCHDKQLVLNQQAKGLTGFRDGDVNLHFMHVNKPDRGRNCRACHSTHASTNPMHLRESVPFGKWDMPINFIKTETGGSCLPGCHKELAYNREQSAAATGQTGVK